RHRHTYNFTTSGDQLFDLCHRGADIRSVGLSHRLDDDRCAAADLDVLYLYCFRLSHHLPLRRFSGGLPPSEWQAVAASKLHFAGVAITGGLLFRPRQIDACFSRSFVITKTISRITTTKPTC